MKAKEITLNLTRNLGNYETARMAVTYEVTDDDDVVDSFVSAKMEIDEAFERLFPEYYGYRNGDNYVEKTGKTDGINVIDDFGTTTIMYDDGKINTKTELTENSPEYEQIKARLKKGTMTLDELKEYYELDSDIINKLLTN
jgi:hypothetical protein